MDREAVELVMVAHLHPAGGDWNLTGGCTTFYNARYLVPRSE